MNRSHRIILSCTDYVSFIRTSNNNHFFLSLNSNGLVRWFTLVGDIKYHQLDRKVDHIIEKVIFVTPTFKSTHQLLGHITNSKYHQFYHSLRPTPRSTQRKLKMPSICVFHLNLLFRSIRPCGQIHPMDSSTRSGLSTADGPRFV